MKKTFIFLLLVALFAIPRSAQAGVTWEVSDGTVQRINPNNPSNPNDLVTIPAGVEFCRIMCGYYQGNRYLIIDVGDQKITGYIVDDNNNALITPRFADSYVNFPDNCLRYRLLERALGYNYYTNELRAFCDQLRSQGGAVDSHSPVLRSHYCYRTNQVMTSAQRTAYQGYLNYLRRCIITKDEAKALKVLNLEDKDEYHYLGINVATISRINGLEIFENLETLSLKKNYFLGQYVNGCGKIPLFTPDFTQFTKLKVLDLSGTDPFACDTLPPMPQTIEELYLPDAWIMHVTARNYPNIRILDLTNCTVVYIDVENCPTLHSLRISSTAKLRVLKCRNTDIDQLDLSGSPALKKVYCSDNMLTSLTFHPDVNLNTLECQRNNLSTLTVPGTFTANTFYIIDQSTYEKIKYTIAIECPIVTKTQDPDDYYGFIYRFYNKEGYLQKEVKTRMDIIEYAATHSDVIYYGESSLDCSENGPLARLSLPSASNLNKLSCWNCVLPELDVTACDSLKVLRMSNNRINEIDLSHCTILEELYANNWIGTQGHPSWTHGLTSLDCSGLSKLRLAQLSRNKMTDLNMSGCSSIQTLFCDNQGGNDRLLRTLNLKNCNNLTKLECQNNALTSLNLTDCQNISYDDVKAYVQRAIEDVTVLDRNKVCIELPNGVTTGIAMDDLFGTWTNSGFDKNRSRIITKTKKGVKYTYLVLYDISDDARGGSQPKADVDFYEKDITYQYALWDGDWDETLGGSLANNRKKDNVTVTTYPYVMYINPATLDKYTDPQNTFYSGTIFLGYDAVLPEGAEAYIAVGFQKDESQLYADLENTTMMQLNLVKLLPGEGATHVVIPKNTAVYIKSPIETGLFDYARNLNNEALAVLPSGVSYNDNKFKGSLTPITDIAPLSVLSLGRGRSINATTHTEESRVGFWRFTGTTIPAHRAYIDCDDIETPNANNVRGLTFAFFDSENALPTSIDRMERVTNTIDRQQQGGWYTVSGIRLKEKPSAKGVYIHNGKKVFVE